MLQLRELGVSPALGLSIAQLRELLELATCTDPAEMSLPSGQEPPAPPGQPAVPAPGRKDHESR